MKFIGQQLQVSVKGPGNFVSTADKRAEKLIRQELARARPGYGLKEIEASAADEDGWQRARMSAPPLADPLRLNGRFFLPAN